MNKIERTCPNCGKTYWANPNRLAIGRQTTCGRQCSYEMRGAGLSKQHTLTCATCGDVFRRSPSYVRSKADLHYCSRTCYAEGIRRGIAYRVYLPRGPLTEEGRRAIQNAPRPTRGKKLVHHWLTCEGCGKQFDDPYYGKPRKRGIAFCSLDCCNAYRVGPNSPTWNGGGVDYYGTDWPALRRAARKRDHYTCQRCGISQREVGRALDVHHIVPVATFAEPNDANTLDNVISLCRSCHGLTEWELRRSTTAAHRDAHQ